VFLFALFGGLVVEFHVEFHGLGVSFAEGDGQRRAAGLLGVERVEWRVAGRAASSGSGVKV